MSIAFDMTGQTVVITGASRGIGAAIAHRMARAGANVILSARSKAGIQKQAADITAASGRATARVCDVTTWEEVKTLADYVVAEHGRIDVWVNNAGTIDPIARMTDSNPSEWGAVVDVNVKGVYHGLRAALPIMERQGSGTVINISSGAANSALEGWSHYCATKAAAKMLTACAHKEVGAAGVRVVGLSPGTVRTQMQEAIRASGINPVSRIDPERHIPPEWAAEAVVFLCTPDAAEFAGTDFSIKTDSGRDRVGLPRE